MEIALGLYEKAIPSGLSWQQMLLAAKTAGFDQLEISIDESNSRLSRLDWTQQQCASLRRDMDLIGLPVRTMCLSGHRKYPFGSHDPATRQRSLDIMRKAVDLACELGIRLIQLAGYDVYYEIGDEQTRAWFVENLGRAVDYAARCGVVLGFETMETPFMDTITKGMTYVKALQSPYLGMYPDLGNLTNACYFYHTDICREIQAGADHCFAMHLKETVEGVYRDMDFGTGRVNFVQGVRHAMDIGVRLFTAECWHDGREDWPRRLAEINRFLRDSIRQAQLLPAAPQAHSLTSLRKEVMYA